MNNPVAKNFQKFNKNKVEVDRKKEVKKRGEPVDLGEELCEDDTTEQQEDE